jgi:hypothetical protein
LNHPGAHRPEKPDPQTPWAPGFTGTAEFKRFLAALPKDRFGRHARRAKQLRRFFRHLGDKPPEALTVADLFAYRLRMSEALGPGVAWRLVLGITEGLEACAKNRPGFRPPLTVADWRPFRKQAIKGEEPPRYPRCRHYAQCLEHAARSMPASPGGSHSPRFGRLDCSVCGRRDDLTDAEWERELEENSFQSCRLLSLIS